MNEYASWPPTFSNTSSVKGVGKGSCRQAYVVGKSPQTGEYPIGF
jgi:hypothetical protein